MSFLNNVVNFIKVGGIKATDILNKLYDPFDEFTRNTEVRYQELLHVKEKRFFKNMVENFSHLDGRVWSYKVTKSGFIDIGDQCIWHGIYTAMWALAYAVNKEEESLERLRLCMVGLNLHQTAHGEPQRRLIRGIKLESQAPEYKDKPNEWWDGPQLFFKKNGYIIEDSASNDSAAGHLIGIYYAWLYGDADIKDKAKVLAQGFADELINHNYSIVLPNGDATEFGVLINGWKTDPVRLLLCLATLKVASVLTGNELYEKHYSKIEKEYNRCSYTKYGKVKLFNFENHPDTHRVALLQHILIDLENNPEISKVYLEGLKRTWKVVHKSMNVWIAFLYASHFKLTAKELSDCKRALSEFSVEDKWAGNIEKINSKDVLKWKNEGVKFFQWQKGLRSSQPLPAWKMGQQDFKWQRHPFSVDDWVGNKSADSFYNGGDFLLCYYLGRVLGLITEID